MKQRHQFIFTIVLGILLLSSTTALSQEREYEKTMSYKQLIDGITDTTNTLENRIVFRSVTFEFKEEAEDSIFIKSVKNPISGILMRHREIGRIKATASVVFFDCKFDNKYHVEFDNCEFFNIEFVNCDLTGLINFNNCLFKGNFNYLYGDFDNQYISIDSSIFIRSFIISSKSAFKKVHFLNNIFYDSPFPYHSLREQYDDWYISHTNFEPFNISRGVEIENLILYNSDFTNLSDTTMSSLKISYASIDNFSFIGNKLFSIGIEKTKFNDLVEFDKLELKNIFIDGVSFPTINTNVSWDFIAGNKLIYNDNGKAYKAEDDEQLANTFAFYNLLSSYKVFYQIYKTRGDRESANGCYVEMKDLETDRLRYVNKQTPTIFSWFNWKLNLFLKYFCDYGTNPIKSLIISMWTILGFALFYFFFYSDWDKINRTFLIRQHRKLLEYFRSEQKMEEFHVRDYKEKVQEYHEYKTELENSKIEIPFFIWILGKPLFHLSLVRFNTLNWVYRRTEILSGKWVDLIPARKIYVGMIVSFVIFFYLFYLIIIRALNSIILSINTFSTLGFGDIPVKGITRYIAILEGFLGWFLLSIFSVSLISQILQN